MRSSSASLTLILVSALLLFTVLSISADEKRISVYSTIANYSLSTVDRQGRDYVGLLEILEPLGKVNSRSDGNRWKIRFGSVDGEFTTGKTRGKISGRDADLAAPFLLENGRGMIPLASLGAILPRFLGGPVNFHENARRLFVGNFTTPFTVDFVKTTPPRLVFNFGNVVNPTISTEPGHLRMVFVRDPVVATTAQDWKFEDHMITSVAYSENNGAAEITVNSTVSLMASFSAGGRTITVTAPPSTSPGAIVNVPSGSMRPMPPATNPVTPPLPPPAAQHRFVIMIDAGHGGAERGAAITDQLGEKDVNLAFARQLRHELETRGVGVLMLRDGDTFIPLDQRAAAANSARPAIYVNIHSTGQGTGIRMYSAMLPSAEENKGPFIDWNTAQAASLALSQQFASGAAVELQKRNIPARILAAPLRPLNNVVVPSLTIDLGPPSSNVADVNSPTYQQPIAAILAEFLASQKARLEAPR